MGICWRDSRCLDLSFLAILPVVIRGNRDSAAVVQFQGRILQRILDSEFAE